MIDNERYSIILPARIVEYFPEDQTATVQVSAEVIYNSSDSLAEPKSRVPLEGVPVHTPFGGGWSMTMPIKQGDTCLMLFSQIGYDHWLYDDLDEAGTLANVPKPWLGRQFNDDDGFCFVGVNTLPRAIADYQADDAEFRNVDREQRISLVADGSLHIKAGTTTINLTSSGAITVTTSANVDVVSPLVTMSGDLTVTGDIIANEVTASGIVLTSHVHGQPATGADATTQGNTLAPV